MALPALEWGINWCISMRANRFLMLSLGSGGEERSRDRLSRLAGEWKTTLSAGLMLRGVAPALG